MCYLHHLLRLLDALPPLKMQIGSGMIFEIAMFGKFGDRDYGNFGASKLLEGSSLPPCGSP